MPSISEPDLAGRFKHVRLDNECIYSCVFPQNRCFHTYHRMLQSHDQPPLPWNHERTVAISAVRRACIVTKKVFETLVNTDYMTKNDQSPVTGVL